MKERANALTLKPTDLGLPPQPIGPEDAHKATELLGYASNCANLIGPITQVDRIPPGYRLAFRILLLPLDGMLDERGVLKGGRFLDNGLWHKIPGGGGKPDKVSLEKAGLDHIASACGVQYLPPRRVDDGQTQHYWRYQAGIKFRVLDGTWRECWDEVEYDLRDGTPQAKTDAKNIDNARKFGARNCISKARNRAIRAAFGIRPLEVWQAERPFVVPTLQWVPDMSNPEVAKMVAAKELGIVDDIYGTQPTVPDDDQTQQLGTQAAPPLRQIPDHGGSGGEDLERDLRRGGRRPAPKRNDEGRGYGGRTYDYDRTDPDDPASWERS